MDRVDQSVIMYIDKAQQAAEHVINEASCKSIETTKDIVVAAVNALFGLPGNKGDNVLRRYRQAFEDRTPENSAVENYLHFAGLDDELYLVSCRSRESELYTASERLRQNVQQSVALWTRMEDRCHVGMDCCENARECYPLLQQEASVAVSQATEFDLKATKAAERLKRVNETVITEDFWEEYDAESAERNMASMMQIKDELLFVRSVRNGIADAAIQHAQDSLVEAKKAIPPKPKTKKALASASKDAAEFLKTAKKDLAVAENATGERAKDLARARAALVETKAAIQASKKKAAKYLATLEKIKQPVAIPKPLVPGGTSL
jgi:hypothetical protein